MNTTKINRIIGIGDGYAVFRTFYKKPNGETISIDTSRPFSIQDEPDAEGTWPSDAAMFEKYKMETTIVRR